MGIAAGFDKAMVRFEACMHALSNLHIEIDDDHAAARYYEHGWHWVRDADRPAARTADFLVLGVMRDAFVRQASSWRVSRRHLTRQGPNVAVGQLPDFLAGLGEG